MSIRKIAASVLLLSLLPVPALAQSKPKNKWLIPVAAMVAGQMADAATTCHALTLPNVRETNAGLYGSHPSCRRVMLTKVAVMVPFTVAAHRSKSWHVASYFLAAGGAALAAWNLHQIKGAK